METEGTSIHKSIAMHKQSRTLSKSKPKIRIIHVFAPEIIKTNVSNFREIVQSLTGKEDHHHDAHHEKGLKRNSGNDDHHQVHDMSKNHGLCINYSEVEHGREKENGMSMTWNGMDGESSGGFSNGLGGDYHQDLGEFSYSPLTMDPSVAYSTDLRGGDFAESYRFS